MDINIVGRGTQTDALNTADTYNSLDPSGLRDRLRSFPDQCEQAWSQTQDFRFPDSWNNPVIVRVILELAVF